MVLWILTHVYICIVTTAVWSQYNFITFLNSLPLSPLARASFLPPLSPGSYCSIRHHYRLSKKCGINEVMQWIISEISSSHSAQCFWDLSRPCIHSEFIPFNCRIVLRSIHLQLIFIIPGFHICKFTYVLKFLTPKSVLWHIIADCRIVTNLSCAMHMFPAEVEQGNPLLSCFSSHIVKQCFVVYLMPSFSSFCAFCL